MSAGLGCEILFDEDEGRRMQKLVEAAVGGPCPCKTGRSCPLIPEQKVIVELRKSA